MYKAYAARFCALVLLITAPAASAARFSAIAVHYSQFNDVGIADVTLSVVTESSPKLLIYFGDNIRYDVTAGEFFGGGGHNARTSFVYAGPAWK